MVPVVSSRSRQIIGWAAARLWIASLVATGVSTWALDMIATAAGLALVASGAFDGFEPTLLWVLLLGSYLVWWAGLRVNLAANWLLLERTGTSTNVLSKLANELAANRRTSLPCRRLAASAGYVAGEVAKEAPYYFGAFGAALISDAVSAREALIFLAGANLGAAAYEYGLGRGVVAFLGLASVRRHASFETEWEPGSYLADFYRDVAADERRTISFFVEALKNAQPGSPILLFGVGPTLHHAFLAAGMASELHLGDYLPANLREIERWLAREPAAHDWRPFVRYTLSCESGREPDPTEVAEREDLVRSKATRLMLVDLRRSDPMLGQADGAYSTVISAYCADSATADRSTWETYMIRIAELVQPGGLLLVAALRRSHGYRVGTKLFPSANVDEEAMRAVLSPLCETRSLRVEACRLQEHALQGYTGIVLASGRRRIA